MSQDKQSVMYIAATLTQAALSGRGGSGTPFPVDPTNQDPQQRALTLETWEIFRAFYAGVEGALADDTNWAPPKGSAAPTVPPAITAVLAQPAIASAIAGSPALAPLATILKAAGLLAAVVAPATPLPNPGASTTTVSA